MWFTKGCSGRLGDGSLALYTLPETHCHLEEVKGTYYTLLLIEYSRWRSEVHEHDPSMFSLYKKQEDGRITKVGDYLRASIDGNATNDPFEKAPLDFCATIPEPTRE